MPPDEQAVGYHIWGADQAVYGPVELPTLVEWIKDDRVISDTWLHLQQTGCWEKASRVPELRMFFKNRPEGEPAATATGPASPAALRHIKLLATLTDAQLERFVQTAELVRLPPGKLLVKPGDAAEAMYLVLDGELRLKALNPGQEPTISTLCAGDFFGELALFDHGPHSVEVVSGAESLLMKIPARSLETFVHESADLAAPVLFAITRSIACHLRAESKRFRDSICFPRTTGHY